MIDARASAGDILAPRRGHDCGTLLAGALLAAVALLAWAVLVGRASGTGVGLSSLPISAQWAGGRAPVAAVRRTAAVVDVSDDHAALVAARPLPTPAQGGTEDRRSPPEPGESAIVELRAWLRAQGFPASVVHGPMSAVRYDAEQALSGPGEEFWPRGAWLVSSPDGRWWVWRPDTVTPADDDARAAVGLVPADRLASAPRGRLEDVFTAPWAAVDAGARAVLPLASFLAGWGLVVLAVVLPGLVPVVAAYGAARRRAAQGRRMPLHALLFALPAAGLWLAAGVLVLAGREAVLAAAAVSPALAARLPEALALGIGVVALHRLSPLHEGALLTSRRSAAQWARRAVPGCRGTLAVGWMHGLASLGAGAGLVALLVLGAAGLPWALAVGLLLFAERVLPRGDRTARAAGGVLVALALVAVAWPAPARAALRGTIAPPRTAAASDEVVPALPLLRTLVGHADAVTAIAFSPDGALLASASLDNTVRLWDTTTGRAVRVLQRDRLRSGDAAPLVVAFSRTGAMTAIGDADGAVSAWDTATGRSLRGPPRRDRPASRLAFPPLAATVAVGYADAVVVQWDLVNGREVWVLPPREATYATLAFSPDGRTVAVGGWYAPLTLRDAATGRERRILAPDAAVQSLGFSPDGGVLVVTGNNAVTLWDVVTGDATHALPSPSTRAVGFSPEGETLTTGGLDGVLRSWEVATGRALGAARVPEPIALVAIAPRRMVVATVADPAAGVEPPAGSATNSEQVRLWNARPDRS